MATTVEQVKRPSDAEAVRFLKRAALFLSAMADAAPEFSPTREEGLSLKDGCYGFAEAIEQYVAEFGDASDPHAKQNARMKSPAAVAEREVINAARKWHASIQPERQTSDGRTLGVGVRDGSSESLHTLYSAVNVLAPMYAYPLRGVEAGR